MNGLNVWLINMLRGSHLQTWTRWQDRGRVSTSRGKKCVLFTLSEPNFSPGEAVMHVFSSDTPSFTIHAACSNSRAPPKARPLSLRFALAALETVILRPAAQKYVSIIPFCTLLMESARRLVTSGRIVLSSDTLWPLRTILPVLLSTSLWPCRSNHVVCSLTAA